MTTLIDFQDSFKNALKRWMIEYGLDVVEVVDFQDDTESGGYCDSCWYETAVVVITYIDSAKKRHKFSYQGQFGELIKQL